MGKWRWTGFNEKGRKVSGTKEAESAKELRRLLRADGIKPLQVKPPTIFELDLGEIMVEAGLSKPFGLKELQSFTRQLTVMIDAGVPILQSLEILYKQEKHPFLKKTVKKIAEDVGSGKTLSEAMEQHKGFSKLYCNLVKAGESGGILDTILNKLSEYMEKQQKIKSQIKSAMTYPTIVVIVGVAVVWGMMVFVVPKFTEMLRDGGQEVPAVTQFVIDVSNFLQTFGIHLVVGIVVGLFAFLRFIKTPSGKYIFDRYTMQMPIFGGIIVKGNLSSFARTLATMLGAGISLIDSLEICTDTIDNTVIAKDIKLVRDKVVEGKTMTDPLQRIRYFPNMVAQMIKVGESTGNMDIMLVKVADVFEKEVEDLVGNMTKLIEPIILVGLGGVIGVILIAMYLPIFMQGG